LYMWKKKEGWEKYLNGGGGGRGGEGGGGGGIGNLDHDLVL